MVSADSEVRPDPGPTLRPHHRKTSEAGPEHLSTSSLPTMSGCRRRVTARVLHADAPVLCGLLAEWRALIANMTVPELRVPPALTSAHHHIHLDRRARYRGLPKTRLDHVYMACALNLLRLEAFWTGTPLDRQRTSHLARLELSLVA